MPPKSSKNINGRRRASARVEERGLGRLEPAGWLRAEARGFSWEKPWRRSGGQGWWMWGSWWGRPWPLGRKAGARAGSLDSRPPAPTNQRLAQVALPDLTRQLRSLGRGPVPHRQAASKMCPSIVINQMRSSLTQCHAGVLKGLMCGS